MKENHSDGLQTASLPGITEQGELQPFSLKTVG